MVNINRLTEHWNEADQFLDEKYSQSKQYVDNMLNPEYVIDDEAVMSKVVPEKVSTGMVAKICGKTIKSPNLWSEVWEAGGVNSFNGADYNGDLTYHRSEYIPVKGSTKYTVINTSGSAVNSYEYDSTKNYIKSHPAEATASFTTDASCAYIRIEINKSYGMTYNKDVAVIEGTATAYIPSGLLSTPVESVVSVGKNIFNKNDVINSKYINMSDGVETSTSITSRNASGFIPVAPNTEYHITAHTSSAWGAWYDAGKNFVASIGGYGAVTSPANARYMRLTIETNNLAITQIEKGSVATSYEPYYEITALVPSEARNCVGYGLGIDDTDCNIADFENGVYTQNVEKYTLGNDAYIQMPEAGLFFFTDFTSYGSALCSKYKFVNVNVENNAAAKSALNEGEFTYRHGSTNDRIYVKDSSIANAGDFKTKNLGMEFICTLPSSAKKTIPLTDYIRPLPVSNGGTITFVNENNLNVPNTIIYKKEVI